MVPGGGLRMPCVEWCKCVERYRRAVQAYNNAVTALDCVPGSEFDHSWQRAENARKGADGARSELLAHEHDHGCPTSQDSPGESSILSIATEDLVLGDQGQGGG
jgi:hypothetical protein